VRRYDRLFFGLLLGFLLFLLLSRHGSDRLLFLLFRNRLLLSSSLESGFSCSGLFLGHDTFLLSLCFLSSNTLLLSFCRLQLSFLFFFFLEKTFSLKACFLKLGLFLLLFKSEPFCFFFSSSYFFGITFLYEFGNLFLCLNTLTFGLGFLFSKKFCLLLSGDSLLFSLSFLLRDTFSLLLSGLKSCLFLLFILFETGNFCGSGFGSLYLLTLG
jgi:hypothetical protein